MSNTLNLARKLRPKTFSDVIGQDTVISMLRNSLYKNHFFPVYLFAGQKGCGKTSTARILAAAVNCTALPLFQKNHAQQLPCLTCTSCTHMAQNSHPDFIEIDAASHTGVDDVRTILESCNFMPLLGSKKIYLIDEAHMLSKAAFNAFLKILEEPPAHTVFMMATTEILKIPDTVRSRAFQLHFSAIKETTLASYLASICIAEKIECQEQALALIIHETEGSARDALNLLEQIRFAHDSITDETVRTVLGIVSAQRMAELFALMVEKNGPALLNELNTITATLNPGRIWHLLLQLIRTLIWHSYGVTPQQESLTLPPALTNRLLQAVNQKELQAILNYLWQQEELFLNTPYKQAFLEKIFLDICTGIEAPPAPRTTAESSSTHHKKTSASATPVVPVIKQPTVVQPQPTAPTKQVTHPASGNWQAVCAAIATLNDQLLLSIFNQASIAAINTDTGTISLALPHVSSFFIEKMNDSAPRWKPIIQEHFNGCSILTLVAAAPAPAPDTTPRQQSAAVSNLATPIIPAVIPPKAITIPQARPTQTAAPTAGQRPPYQAKQKQITLPTTVIRGATLVLNNDNAAQWPYTALLFGVFQGKLEIITPEPPQHIVLESSIA